MLGMQNTNGHGGQHMGSFPPIQEPEEERDDCPTVRSGGSLRASVDSAAPRKIVDNSIRNETNKSAEESDVLC